METLFLTNRAVSSGGLADVARPGPIGWGSATCTPAPGSPEGFAWSFDAGAGLHMLTPAAFQQRLAAAVAPGPRPKAVLMHMHGAGCMSADMFCRAANLATLYAGPDLEIVPLLVTWASGSFKKDDYLAARGWLQRDVADLAGAFRVVAAALRAAQVASGGRLRTVLSAHSLGNYLLARILFDCAGRPNGEPQAGDPPFDDVLLLAADVDHDVLDEADPPPGTGLHLLGRWARGVHVYYSHADSVVGLGFLAQAGLHIPGRSGPALGNDGPIPRVSQLRDGTPVDAVNCGFLLAANDGATNHHYWRVDPLAIQDLKAVIRQVPPSAMTWRSRKALQSGWDIFPNVFPPPTG